MKQYEDYWRGIVAKEIEDIRLPRTTRRDVLLGYAMALADAANTARKWGAGNHLALLEEDDDRLADETDEGFIPLPEVQGEHGAYPEPLPERFTSNHPAVGGEGAGGEVPVKFPRWPEGGES